MACILKVFCMYPQFFIFAVGEDNNMITGTSKAIR